MEVEAKFSIPDHDTFTRLCRAVRLGPFTLGDGTTHQVLDRYLDTAYLASLPFVRLIHGKGTGALRQAVRDELRGHPLVSEFRAGDPAEGGEGVTVARLVQR